MVAEYLFTLDMFSGIEGTGKTLFYPGIGAAVYAYTIGTSQKGLEGGAKFQFVLTLLTIIPICAIALAPMLTGNFHFDYIVDDFHPADGWGGNSILMILALLCVDQWSAVGWETAAAYGTEYKNP